MKKLFVLTIAVFCLLPQLAAKKAKDTEAICNKERIAKYNENAFERSICDSVYISWWINAFGKAEFQHKNLTSSYLPDICPDKINDYLKKHQDEITYISMVNPSVILSKLDFTPLKHLKTIYFSGNDFDVIDSISHEILSLPALQNVVLERVSFDWEDRDGRETIKKCQQKYPHIHFFKYMEECETFQNIDNPSYLKLFAKKIFYGNRGFDSYHRRSLADDGIPVDVFMEAKLFYGDKLKKNLTRYDELKLFKPNVEIPQTGSFVVKRKNGQIALEGQFKNGQRDGVWTTYIDSIDANYPLDFKKSYKRQVEYANGKPVKKMYFRKDYFRDIYTTDTLILGSYEYRNGFICFDTIASNNYMGRSELDFNIVVYDEVNKKIYKKFNSSTFYSFYQIYNYSDSTYAEIVCNPMPKCESIKLSKYFSVNDTYNAYQLVFNSENPTESVYKYNIPENYSSYETAFTFGSFVKHDQFHYEYFKEKPLEQFTDVQKTQLSEFEKTVANHEALVNELQTIFKPYEEFMATKLEEIKQIK